MWVNVGKSNQQIKRNNLTDTYQIVRAIISHFEFSQFDVCERVNFTAIPSMSQIWGRATSLVIFLRSKLMGMAKIAGKNEFGQMEQYFTNLKFPWKGAGVPFPETKQLPTLGF